MNNNRCQKCPVPVSDECFASANWLDDWCGDVPKYRAAILAHTAASAAARGDASFPDVARAIERARSCEFAIGPAWESDCPCVERLCRAKGTVESGADCVACMLVQMRANDGG